jgi:hypothetical protein
LRIASSRGFGIAGLLLCMVCAAYFYLLWGSTVFDHAHFTPIFFHLLVVYDRLTAAISLLLCLAALLWTNAEPLLKLADIMDRRVIGLSIAVTLCSSAGALLVYKNYPLSMDEYSAVFQSKIFASGHLAAQLPRSLVPWLIPPGFNGAFLLISPETGRGIEAYWPGYALLLAPFQLIGVPWLCNALLAGASVILIHRIAREVTGERRAAGFAILFALASSVFWADAISYYSMQAHLTANLCFAWLLMKPTDARCLAAGLVGSLGLVLHNPLPHMLFASPWIVALALDRSTRRRLLPLALGYLPALAIGIEWARLRGEIFPLTEDAEAVRTTLKGVFSLPDADILDMRLAALAKMWVWAPPCLYLFAAIGFVRTRGSRHVRLLMWSAACTFLGYLFVKLDQGHGWGYRYFHSAWGVVPVLAACAITGQTNRSLAAFAGTAAVLGLLVLVPVQLAQIEGFIARHLELVPPPRRPGANIYFIDPRGGYYIADMIQIDPRLRSEDLLLFSRASQLNADLMRQNWPEATRCGGRLWVEQWCVGASSPSATDDGGSLPRFQERRGQDDAIPMQTTPAEIRPSPSHWR